MRGDLTALLAALARAPEAGPDGPWATALRPGDRLDRFEILRELGRGGFGAVYEAVDRDLGRRVALKTLRPGRKRDEWADAQLRGEAQAAASLSHPGVVTLFEACTCDKGPYLVMELLRGETLEERLVRGPLPAREAVEIVLQAARALAHVHAVGLVHRDLKPANVFLTDDGRVKLLDLGLAHLLGKGAAAAGTPAYVAPEQWRGEEADGRADVFALGAVLFEMLSGRRAFEVREGRSSALDALPAPALEGVPRDLGQLVARCLSKDAAGRPTSAQLAEALLSSQRRPERPRLLRRLVLPAAVAVGVAAAAVAWWRGGSKAPAPGPDGRIVVAVADFANETQDPDLDGLSDLLITSLEQSKRLRVLTRSRMTDVLRQLGKDGTERIDEPLAREVGQREGVRALLHASVRKLGETYAVDLRGLDPVRDQYLFAVREQTRGKEGLLDVIDRLSEKTRLALQEPGADVRASEVKVAEAATSTLEAWRAYVEGLRHEEVGRFDAAVEQYRAAVALDPAFALAHFRIAFRGEPAGLAESERRAAIEAALRELERLPEKEKLLVQAWKARMDGRRAEALAIAARAAESYPRDKEIAFMAGVMAFQGEGPVAAIPWFERALALDPTWGPALNGVVGALSDAGRKEEAVRRAREWVERAPDVTALRQLTLALQLVGRPEEAATVARRILELDGSPVARAWVASALLLADRFDEAEALVRPAAQPGAIAEVRDVLADALAQQGRRREALEVIGWEEKPGSRAWGRYLVLMGDREPGPALHEAREIMRLGVFSPGLITGAYYLGDPALAAEAAARLRPGPSVGRSVTEAVQAWQRGRAEEALAALRALERDGRLGNPGHWWHARIALELGLAEEGEAALAAFEREPSFVWRGWGRAQLRVWAAELRGRRGEREKALPTLDRIEQLWAKADRDLPQLADARALRRRLAVAPAARPPAAAAAPAPAP